MMLDRIRENIIQVMREKDMDEIDLMTATGTSPATMQKWLSGTRIPTAYGLYRIAKALHVSMDSLMYGVEE